MRAARRSPPGRSGPRGRRIAALAATGALVALAGCAPGATPDPEVDPAGDAAPAPAAVSAEPPRRVLVANAIRPRFFAWNPRLALVSVSETRWGGGAEGSPPLYVLAHAIRQDGAFDGRFEDETFGVFEIDPADGSVSETLGFVPTCRWRDCAARIASASPDSITIAWEGETYGDQAGAATFARRGLDDWVIRPSEGAGPVGRTSSEAELRARFGTALEPGEVHIGEGVCSPGATLFGGTPNALEIVWTDETRSLPARIEVPGRGGDWRTPDGLHVGMTLDDLESLRGEVIEFSGFDWDYGGGTGWSEDGAAVGVWLSYDRELPEEIWGDPRYPEVLGDRPVRSDHPLVRRMGVHVREIFITWDRSRVEAECTSI